MMVVVYLLQLTVDSGNPDDRFNMIPIANIVIGIQVESIDMMRIKVLMHVNLAVLIIYVIRVINLVILLFISRMLNAMLVVKWVTLLDTAL